MISKKSLLSQKAFGKRLESQLLGKRKPLSATKLARDFNLRWRGVPISTNAARKWLMGESIPTMDKIDLLANMLDTSTEWLRWGEKDSSDLIKSGNRLEIHSTSTSLNSEKSLIQDYRLLNKTYQKIIRSLIEIMLREQNSMT
jgi:hypothetical protein